MEKRKKFRRMNQMKISWYTFIEFYIHLTISIITDTHSSKPKSKRFAILWISFNFNVPDTLMSHKQNTISNSSTFHHNNGCFTNIFSCTNMQMTLIVLITHPTVVLLSFLERYLTYTQKEECLLLWMNVVLPWNYVSTKVNAQTCFTLNFFLYIKPTNR